MKFKFNFLSIALAAMVAGSVMAKETVPQKEVTKADAIDLTKVDHPVKPMLWKIEGKGLKKPSYLFGTIHLADKRLTTLHPSADEAFNKSDYVYAEVLPTAKFMMESQAIITRKGEESLEDVLGEEIYDGLKVEIHAINPALGLDIFEKMNVWTIALMISQIKDQLNGKTVLDASLIKRAREEGKKVGAIETAQEQMGGMQALTMDEQKELLAASLKAMKEGREKGGDPNAELVNAYLSRDLAFISKMMEDESTGMSKELIEKFNEILLVQRNANMTKFMIGQMEKPDSGTHFFAAGSAHYAVGGEASIVERLKKAGYTVTLSE